MLKNSSLDSNVPFSLVHYEQKNLIWKVKFCKLYQHFLLFQCIKYVFFVSCWVQKEWVSFLQWFTMGQESQNLLSSMNRVHRKKIVGQRLRKENRCKFQKIKKSCLPEQSRVNWLKLTLACTIYILIQHSHTPYINLNYLIIKEIKWCIK